MKRMSFRPFRKVTPKNLRRPLQRCLRLHCQNGQGQVLFSVLVFFSFLNVVSANAPTSYRLANPIGWMHSLPTGEMPGWSSDFWMQLEFSQSNVWNSPIDLQHRSTGQEYRYMADFEQSSAVLELGGALTSFFAFSVELPYAHRDGGGLDRFIDNFHIVIGSLRFNRPEYETNQSIFDIEQDGVDQLDSLSESGLSNIKYKFKLWWLKWRGFQPGSCDCGFATSAHIKVPLVDARRGLTSGTTDYSLLWHLGIPINNMSAFWISSAVTHLPHNPTFEQWPRREWHQMYEVSMDFALTESWGVIFQARMESPFMNKEHLNIIHTTEESKEQLLNRISSGWNGLVHWRGSESLGLRYRISPSSQINGLIIEDFAYGRFDEIGDELYINNAPDVAFVLQTTWGF